MKCMIHSPLDAIVSLRNRMVINTTCNISAFYALGNLSVPEASHLLSTLSITIGATDMWWYRQKAVRVDQCFDHVTDVSDVMNSSH